jgi:hypothetical protein
MIQFLLLDTLFLRIIARNRLKSFIQNAINLSCGNSLYQSSFLDLLEESAVELMDHRKNVR